MSLSAASTAPAAVNAAAEIQRRLHAEPWQLERPLQVRVVLRLRFGERSSLDEQREYDGFLGNLEIDGKVGGNQDSSAVREQGVAVIRCRPRAGRRPVRPDERLDKPGQRGPEMAAPVSGRQGSEARVQASADPQAGNHNGELTAGNRRRRRLQPSAVPAPVFLAAHHPVATLVRAVTRPSRTIPRNGGRLRSICKPKNTEKNTGEQVAQRAENPVGPFDNGAGDGDANPEGSDGGGYLQLLGNARNQQDKAKHA